MNELKTIRIVAGIGAVSTVLLATAALKSSYRNEAEEKKRTYLWYSASAVALITIISLYFEAQSMNKQLA